MKASEKIKAQKIVDRIHAGNFDENDVENIFMRLRAYSGKHRIFREAADFVAHPDARNKGLLNESLEAFFLGIRFYLEHQYQNKFLNLLEPIPLYVKKLLKCQIDKSKPQELKEKFNVTPERLKSRIDNIFKDDKKAKTTQFQEAKGKNDIASIRYLLSSVKAVPAFSAEELIRELIAVLHLNTLVCDENAIIAHQPTIILSVMLLMHKSRYFRDENMFAECCISTQRTGVLKGLPPEDINGGFGELEVTGTATCALPDGQPMNFGYPIFKTKMSPIDYCDESLFSEEPVPNVPGLHWKKLNLDVDLVLLENGKLGRA